MFSLDINSVRSILQNTLPSFQASNTEEMNLGFGQLYYGFTRAIRPRRALVIGSKKGFSVICVALGMRDNEGYGISHLECYKTSLASKEKPILDFVDPSYSVDRGDANHMHGIGFWDEEKTVRDWWARFDVEDHVVHYKDTSQIYLERLSEGIQFDLIIVDGDHSPEGIRFDFEAFLPKLSDRGIAFAHDVHPEVRHGGWTAYEQLDVQVYEKLRLPIYPGLALIRRRNSTIAGVTIDKR
jgi:predicted O-methyltransferase YrrM